MKYLNSLDITKTDKALAEFVLDHLHKHLIVVIPEQDTNPVFLSRLIHDMSIISNMRQMVHDADGNYKGNPAEYIDPWTVDTYPVQRVTGEKRDGNYTGIFPRGELKWHANLNGPTRADGVGLQAIRGVKGTTTSWLDTSLARADMHSETVKMLEDVWCDYHYESAKNWADTPEVQLKAMSRGNNTYRMRILQENIAGTKGFYFYTNNDLKMTSLPQIQEALEDWLFDEQYMYHHHWREGDIVLSDQLLTLHRRVPFPQEVLEQRLLHRWTFPISNAKDPEWILKRNTF